jgi:hypothetical protein
LLECGVRAHPDCQSLFPNNCSGKPASKSHFLSSLNPINISKKISHNSNNNSESSSGQEKK